MPETIDLNNISDKQAENSLVSSFIIQPELLPELSLKVKPEYFVGISNKEIYQALMDLLRQSIDIDLITLRHELEKKKKYTNEIRSHLLDLQEMAILPSNSFHYLNIIKEKWKLRESYMLAKKIQNNVKGGGEYTQIQSDIFDYSGKIDNTEMYKIEDISGMLQDGIKEYDYHIENKIPLEKGIKTGFREIDRHTMLMPHNLYIIAARPAMGKCLGKGTNIIMFDGSTKKVEDIETGDKLMGPDSLPRNVLSLGRGRGMMYLVKQIKGIDYRVNENHILSLVMMFSFDGEFKEKEYFYMKKRIINISVKDYLLTPHKLILNGYKVIFDKYYKTPIPIDKIGCELSEISVVEDKIDDYYGFELDGDGLFLLEDMTVTHNTSLVLKILDNVSQQGKKVLFFSAEMSKIEILERLVCMKTFVTADNLRDMTLDDKRKKYIAALNHFSRQKNNFLIDDSCCTAEEICSQSIRYSYIHKLDLIAIDYLQLLSCSGNHSNENAELTKISSMFKVLSKKLNIPIIELSQLSRDCEKRANKRPILSDLRSSGSLEQDASVVMFIYRDAVYNSNSFDKTKAEIIFSKNRTGPIGTVDLHFQGEYTLFSDREIANTDWEIGTLT